MRNSKGLWVCVVVACILCSLIINVPGYTKYVPYVNGDRSYTLYDGAYVEKSDGETETGKFYAAGGKILTMVEKGKSRLIRLASLRGLM